MGVGVGEAGMVEGTDGGGAVVVVAAAGFVAAAVPAAAGGGVVQPTMSAATTQVAPIRTMLRRRSGEGLITEPRGSRRCRGSRAAGTTSLGRCRCRPGRGRVPCARRRTRT